MRRKWILPGLFILCCAGLLIAQTPQGTKDDLDALRRVIRESEVRLKGLEKQARQSAAAAAESRVQAASLDSLIRLLEAREGKLAREMISVRNVRDSLEVVREQRKRQYIDVARALYKRKLLTPGSSMLLMPEEHRKLALAEVLFNRYAERQQKLAGEITSLADSLERRDNLLDQRRREQMTLLAEQRQEATKLHALERKYSTALRQTRESKQRLERFLQEKEREAEKLEGMIRSLARQRQNRTENRPTAKKKESRKTATEEAPTTSKSAPKKSEEKSEPRPSTSTERRAERSGPFSPDWPVGGRTILQGYGERRNVKTNTVTFNPGVNIAASGGSGVNASAAGEVSLVSWMAGYGTIVIIEHPDGWRTVYANLASAAVSEGSSVSKGERIGTVGEAVDGAYLHFQVWRHQDRKNPLAYLR